MVDPVSSAEGDIPRISGLFPQSGNSGFSNFLTPNPQTKMKSDLPPSWSNMSGLISKDNELSAPANPPTSDAYTTDVDKPKSQEVYRSPPSGLHENEVGRDSQNRNRGRGFRPNSSSYLRNNGGFRNTSGFTDDRTLGSSHHRRSYNQRRNYDRGNKNRHDEVNYKEDYDFEKPNAELAEFLEKIDLNAVGMVEFSF